MARLAPADFASSIARSTPATSPEITVCSSELKLAGTTSAASFVAWSQIASIDVVVIDGIVKLSGAILDERQRGALRVAAENIPGVKKVEDHLVWIEPMSGTVIEAPT